MTSSPILDLAPAQEYLISIGMKPRPYANAVMVAEALERGIKVARSTKNSKRMILSSEGQRFTWTSGVSSINTASARRLVSYKEVTSRLLLNRSINAPENAVFAPEDAERAWSWGKKLLPLVIKPKDENKGTDVIVGVETYDQFIEAFHRVAENRSSLLVEQFHTGVEHRCLTVDNKLVAVTRRRPASVLADGTHTIEELITEKNRHRRNIHQRLKLDPEAIQYLGRNGFTPASVPEDGQRVYLLGASNIHRGGDAIDATDELTAEEVAQVEKAAAQFPGLRLGALDVLLPREGTTGPLSILEVNANPMISMHHLPWEGEPRNVAGAILEAMFPQTAAASDDN